MEFTAIYDTRVMKGVEYYFYAKDIEAAKEFCKHKFNAKNIVIRNEETKEEIEYENPLL